MYKLLLCWRYLRTRYIALASIISVTLGVATLIVVNSVMAGFTQEMYSRLNGVLSDIVFEGYGLGGFPDAEWHMQEIRAVLGDDVVGMTATVHVPAMVSIPVRGQWVTRQVNLIGIDDATYSSVSDFSQYVLHPENQKNLSFDLREGGYDPRLNDHAGWEHRRRWAELEQAIWDGHERPLRLAEFAVGMPKPPVESTNDATEQVATTEPNARPTDPFAAAPIDPGMPQPVDENVFNPARDQHAGIVLGFAIASTKSRDVEGNVKDFFLANPGDDVILTFPSADPEPQAVRAKFTVVDLYESKMSEYDSTLAFVPLSQLQNLRGMIDPVSGVASVSSIQIKLKAGADLELAQQRLFQRFPSDRYPYRVRTWKDMQGPLLQAVQMETTILNILLFMIIAVAGFGILATFFMIVVEKTKDIGILKSLGASNGGVMSIFLTYGLSLGAVGSGVGMVLGLLFVAYINQIAGVLEWITGREVFDPTVYYFQQIPTIVYPLTVGWIVLGAVLIAVGASVLPALRAARLHPVEALRYE